MTNAKPSIFLSYSHNDARWMNRLRKQLGALEREGHLAVWHDKLIGTGSEWLPQILGAIESARAAVLLISPSFLDSGFVLEKEVPAFLERRAQDGLRIFPVLIEPCLWEAIGWLNRMQLKTLPGAKALSEGLRAQAERALVEVAKEILGALEGGKGSSPIEKHAESPAPRSAVHQLPSPPLDFTGRETELAALRAAVQEGKTTAIFGVRGMGGVGKTVLALKLAHEIAPLYPDGQIFLDLQGVTTPLSAAQAMAHVISPLDPHSRLPASESEMTSLYRSVLHGKRVLLLMDNAAGKEQVENLIPPPGSALLVTSRLRFALPGLVERDLDELPWEEARELLLKICPRIGPLAEETARACGNLPLALRVVASTLQEKRTLSPETYLERLSSGRERLEPVDTALALSEELLSEEPRHFWHQLAVFPDTFDTAAAAAVAQVESEAAEANLAELERNSLVEWDEERFRLHDLVRSFVEGRLAPEERQTARERHARYYLEVLWVANRLYKVGSEDLIRGLKQFDLDWANIRAGQAFAAEEASESEQAAQLCNDYPNAGPYCLYLRQTPNERARWLEAALVAARQLGDRANEGVHLGNLGATYLISGEPRRAIELLEQRLAMASEIGNRPGEGNALGNLGNAYMNLGEPRRAIEFYEQSLVITREIGDRRGEGNALISLGVAYVSLGDSQRAIEFYEQALVVACELGDRLGEAKACWNLGLLCSKDPARATELMQICVDIEREIGHPDAGADAAAVEDLRALIG
jgi:tetratricopeptide (TPR) repeat protein